MGFRNRLGSSGLLDTGGPNARIVATEDGVLELYPGPNDGTTYSDPGELAAGLPDGATPTTFLRSPTDQETGLRSTIELTPDGVDLTSTPRVLVPAPDFNGEAAQHNDTGALSWGLASGWTGSSFYRRINGVFYWTAQLTRASWVAGQQIASLSTINRPTHDWIVLGTWAKDCYDIGITASTGVVRVPQAGTGGLVIGGSWPVA